MSRNRLKNSQSMHWMSVIKWVMVAAIVTALGLFYMTSKNQNLQLADETHKLQMQLDKIEVRNQVLAGDLEQMKSSRNLERRLAELHSPLIARGDTRAVWVSLEQNTRARLVRMGTMPEGGLNLESSVVAANVITPASDH